MNIKKILPSIGLGLALSFGFVSSSQAIYVDCTKVKQKCFNMEDRSSCTVWLNNCAFEVTGEQQRPLEAISRKKPY